MHFKDDTTNYSKDFTKEELIEFLTNKGISQNYNEPMSREQIKRLGEDKLRIIYNNIQATHNLVNIQQVKGGDLEITDTDKYEYILTYSFPCVTEDSLILTKDGYKEYRELNVGDYVLTKSNTWQKIAKKFDNGVHKTYYLQGMGFENIHCTANHKFYVREKYRKGHKSIRCFKEPVFKEVKDITKNDYFGVPIIKEEIPFYTEDLDFWYMIGYYLGDGWLSNTGSDVILACNEKKLEKLKAHLDINKWHYTYHWNSSCYRLRFADKEIYEFILNNIGTGSFEKRICGEILRMPKEQLNALLEGYIDSDGCRIKKNIQFSSVNRGLIYGISSIVNKVYHRATCISKNIVSSTKIIEGREVNQHDWYLLRFKPMNDIQDKAFYENGYIWYPFTKLVEDKEEHVYNMEIENDHSYIIQGCISKNCQDLSLAGLGKGMEKGSGTRSGMLWEVERILDELKSSDKPLPQVLLMENVPQVHGTKNKETFDSWCKKLESLGYLNDWKDLNAKNYGVPQNRNRTFMISRLGATEHFEFPEQIALVNRLKDLLEDYVDEKYYLSDKIVSKLKIKGEVKDITGVDLNDTKSELRDVSSTIKARYDCGYEHFSPGPTGIAEPTLEKVCNDASGNNFNSVYNGNGISPTLMARDYKDPVRIATEEIQQVAQMYPNSGNPQAGRIYTSEGVSPCLDTCMGGNREVKITEDPFIVASRGRNPENPNCREKGQYLEQILEPKFDGTSNTLTTVQKDNYLVEPRIIEVNKNAKHQQDLVQHQDGIARCLCCGTHGSSPHLTKTLVETEPQCIEHNITTIVKVRKYPVDTQALRELLRERKSQLKYNNDYIAAQLSVPKTNVEHWFRNDEHFSIPTPDIWYKLKDLLQITTDEFDKSIMTFEKKECCFEMQNRAYDSNGISATLTCGSGELKITEPTCTPLQKEVCSKALDFLEPNDTIDYTYSNSRLEEINKGYIKTKNSEDNGIMNTLTTNAENFGVCVDEKEDNLKRQLCNKLIEENKVQEGDIIRHSYTNSRFDSFHIENKDSHECCATINTRADCLGYVEDSMYTETEKRLFTEDGNIRRYVDSDIIDKFDEGQMATTSFPNGYGHGSRTHNESITLNTIDKPSVKMNLRIRKLTPKECFRLQCVTDKDFENCAENQSNASLYHLAGDSICSCCLGAIFGTLFNIDWKQKYIDLGLIRVIEDDLKQKEVKPKLEKFSWDI